MNKEDMKELIKSFLEYRGHSTDYFDDDFETWWFSDEVQK